MCARGEEGPPPSYSKALFLFHWWGNISPPIFSWLWNPPHWLTPLPLSPPKCSTSAGPSAHPTAKATHIHTLLYIFLVLIV